MSGLSDTQAPRRLLKIEVIGKYFFNKPQVARILDETWFLSA